MRRFLFRQQNIALICLSILIAISHGNIASATQAPCADCRQLIIKNGVHEDKHRLTFAYANKASPPLIKVELNGTIANVTLLKPANIIEKPRILQINKQDSTIVSYDINKQISEYRLWRYQHKTVLDIVHPVVINWQQAKQTMQIPETALYYAISPFSHRLVLKNQYPLRGFTHNNQQWHKIKGGYIVSFTTNTPMYLRQSHRNSTKLRFSHNHNNSYISNDSCYELDVDTHLDRSFTDPLTSNIIKVFSHQKKHSGICMIKAKNKQLFVFPAISNHNVLIEKLAHKPR
jgi:hypothetical protein